MTIRGVLFDCDGVLVSSLNTAERAWSDWAVHYSLDPAEVLAGIHGRRSRETVEMFLPSDQRSEGVALIDDMELSSADETIPIPGAVELLASMEASEYAVVTSAPRRLVLARMAAAGFVAPVHLVTSEDVDRGKPDPACYLLGAEILGLDPAQCAVVEDSLNGITSGRSAGAGLVVGVGPDAAVVSDLAVTDLRELRWSAQRGLTA